MVLLACLLIVVVGCGTELEPLRATTVTVTPGAATLTSVGQSAAFTATVTDQHGSVFAGTVMWTSDAPNVFTVDPAGVATAVSNGTGTIRAQVDGVSGTATVTVSQRPTAVDRVGGDGQRGRPGMPLVEPLVARILDAGGSPVAGTAVFFSPADGNGFVTPGTAPTDIAGEARATWTLGDDFGHQSLVASVADGANTVFTAQAQRPDELADSVEIVSGDGQAARPGKGLRRPIVVRVLDEHDAPVEGAMVVFEALAGHGFADPDSVRSDRRGDAATTWTLGDKAGLQLLTATVPGGPGARVTAMASEGVCGRTPQVRDALMNAAGVSACDEVTDDLLGQIHSLNLYNMGIEALQDGDFLGLSRLERLFLKDNRLTGISVGVFAGLSNLKDLSLSDNQLEEISIGVFAHLESLESLNLHGNRLDLHPGVFTGLPNLKDLRLGYSGLAELRVGVFAGLSSLEVLILSDNQLSYIPAHAFAGLSNLEELLLVGNQLTELSPDALYGLSDLRELYLSENQLADLPRDIFSGLPKLVLLGVGDNALTSLPTGIFNGLSKLDNLGLGDNQLGTLPKGVFSGLSNLRDLDLARNQLQGLQPGIFDELTGLQTLRLGDNRLAEVSSSVLRGPSALQVLDLSENELNRLPYNLLDQFPRLRAVDLRGNQLAELPTDIFSSPDSLEAMLASSNQLSELPVDLLSGLGKLRWIWLHENPGSPFPFVLHLERTDTSDVAAPGPATVAVTVDEGAPFAMEVTLYAPSASISPSTVTIATGATRSNLATVTANAAGPITVRVSSPIEVPGTRCIGNPCYDGIVVALGNPIKLFR